MTIEIRDKKQPVDVLFIHPGDQKAIYQGLTNEFTAVEPPAFAGLYATYLRKKGKSVAIFDVQALQLSAEDAVERILENYSPTLVVMAVYGMQPSASTQNMDVTDKIGRLLKAANPELKILLTGTHPAALPRLTMTEQVVDFVCDREGPVTIYKTLLALEAKEDFGKIPSLWWRFNGEIMSPSESEPLIDNIDEEMPGIAWDLLPMHLYRAHNWHCFDHIDERSPYASIHTTLGCPYKCSFCCINAPFGKSSYRMYKPETIIKEIDVLVRDYGVKNIKFVDEMFVLNKRHVEAICDLIIERGYDINIWAYARIDTVMDDLLDKMKAAGFNWLCLGIESANSDVRDGADKALKNADIKAVVRRIQNAGIRIIDNYIFGLPSDDHARMTETLELSLELNCEFTNYYSAMAYPGSRLYQESVINGVQLPSTWRDFSQHSYGTLPLANDHLTAAEILAFRDQAFQRKYTYQPYLDKVKAQFGDKVVDHINRMIQIPLKRKLLEEPQVLEQQES